MDGFKTEITNHRTNNSKMWEIAKTLTGSARLNSPDDMRGNYFSLEINTCLNYTVTVFSTHVDGYNFDNEDEGEMMTEEVLEDLASFFKRSTKWKFTDKRATTA